MTADNFDYATALLHRRHLVDPGPRRSRARKGPSTVIACQLCAGVTAVETLQILLGRGNVWSAPHAIQLDGYRNRLTRTWRPGGNRHHRKRLAIAIGKHQLGIQRS